MKLIATAVNASVELSDKRRVVVQELAYMGALKTLKIIQKLISKARSRGSFDELLATLRDAGDDSGNVSVDKLLAVVDMILSIVGDDEHLLPEALSYCMVGDWTTEDIEALPLDDIISLMKSAYEVNWVKGSLKKVLSRVGLKFEETPSKTPQALPETPSTTPELVEKTSTTEEPSTP